MAPLAIAAVAVVAIRALGKSLGGSNASSNNSSNNK